MPTVTAIALLITLVGALPLAADNLALSVADVDSLVCPPRDITLRHLDRRLAFDTVLRARHLRELLAAYVHLASLREQLNIHNRMRRNLELIHAVLAEQQRRAEVSDLTVLQSHQRLLESDLAELQVVRQIRETILGIADLAFLDIVLSPSSLPDLSAEASATVEGQHTDLVTEKASR